METRGRSLNAVASRSASHIATWIREAQESGIWFAFAIVLVFGVAVGVLDASRWNHEFSNSVFAEMNAVVVELFIVGVVIAIYDFRRRRKQEIHDHQRELLNLRLSPDVDRKVELIDALALRGIQLTNLDHHVWKAPNSMDFSFLTRA